MDNLKSKAKLSIKQIVIICLVCAVSAAIFITASYFMLYEPDPGITDVPFITDTDTVTNDPTGTETSTDPQPTYVPTDKKSYNFLVIFPYVNFKALFSFKLEFFWVISEVQV